MDIKKTFETDPKKELEGVWEDIREGCKFLIARFGNKNFQTKLTNLLKPHRQAMRRNTLADDIYESCVSMAAAQYILLGWEGMYEGEAELVYSKEEAKRLFDAYPDFREQILDLSNALNLFKTEENLESEKN